MKNRTDSAELDFLNREDVFCPHPITHLMSDSLPNDLSGKSVLDLCTGSGFIAISAARKGAQTITATDISNSSVEIAKANIEKAGFSETSKVIRSDFFNEISNSKFDIIVSNPPCMPFPAKAMYLNEGYSIAVDGGTDGADFMVKVAKESVKYLNPNGRIYLPVPDWADTARIISSVKDTYSSIKWSPETTQVPYFLDSESDDFKLHIKKLINRKNLKVLRYTKNDVPVFNVRVIIGCT